MKLTIIGAGIGGLTTATALLQKGIDVEIYESFGEFKDLGAGIMLANNAMQVFQYLGLDQEIIQQGNVFQRINLTDPQLNILSQTSTTKYASNKVPTVAIHRSVLQRILLQKIPSDKLYLGKRLSAIKETESSVELEFEDGGKISTNAVIGADGIRSKTRSSVLNKENIRNAQQICWRGVTEFKMPEKHQQELNELWGKASRFGSIQIAENKVYWYALIDHKQEAIPDKKDLPNYFKNYHPLVNQIIQSTPKSKILVNKMEDLQPITQWHTNRICLIGDAAHATTPNMGQGACQSIEDAYTLANCLHKEESLPKAFEHYQNLRMKKAHKVVNTSWSIGKMAHWSHPFMVGLRNLMLKNTPESMLRKQNEFLFQLSE